MTGTSVVYVMAAPDGRVKVGHSQDVDRRRPQARWSKRLPSLDVVYRSEPTALARWIERHALASLRALTGVKRGEWFAVPVSVATNAVRDAIDQSRGVPLSDAPPIKSKTTRLVIAFLDEMLSEVDEIVEARYGQADRAAIIRELVAQALAERKRSKR
jgi:hypothetical protein